MIRHKPRYNSQRLTYVDGNDEEYMFYCDEVTYSKQITMLLNQPVKDSGKRFITESDIDFEIDRVIVQNGVKHRITDVPEIRPNENDNNSRRGHFKKAKVIVTT